MSTIYKYHLDLGDNSIRLPKDARPLSAGEQATGLVLWVLLRRSPREHELSDRKFEVYGTGHDVDATDMLTFIDTVQAAGGTVWHVFERD